MHLQNTPDMATSACIVCIGFTASRTSTLCVQRCTCSSHSKKYLTHLAALIRSKRISRTALLCLGRVRAVYRIYCLVTNWFSQIPMTAAFIDPSPDVPHYRTIPARIVAPLITTFPSHETSHHCCIASRCMVRYRSAAPSTY